MISRVIRTAGSFLLATCVTGLAYAYGKNMDINYRKPLYPLLSGDAFRYMADFVFDELSTFDPEEVGSHCSIFVGREVIDRFIKKFHPLLKHRYVLITHNADLGIDERFLPLLNDDKLIVWFAENTLISHKKLIPIPIGIENRYNPNAFNTPIQALMRKTFQRRHVLYLNICQRNDERVHVQKLFLNKSYTYSSERKSYSEFLVDLARSVFVLSPPGNGFDCHRTWEALYMNSIPIVRSSPLDPVFEDLPVLIVDEWEQINEKFLHAKFKQLKDMKHSKEKLYHPYWLNLIKRYKTES